MVLKKQILFSTGTTISRALSGFVLIFILSRFLNVELFGIFTYSLVVASFLVLVVDYGFDLQLSRDTALIPEKIPITMANAIKVKLLLIPALPLLLGILSYVGVIPISDVVVISLLLAAQTAYSFQKSLLVPYRSVQNYKQEFIYSILAEIFLLIVCVSAAFYHVDLITIAAAYCTARLISALAYVCLFQKNFRFNFQKTDYWAELKVCFPFFVHTALASIYLSVDTLIMRNYVSEFDLGIYQAGTRSLLAACLLVPISQNVILPHLARMLNDETMFLRESRKYLFITSLLGAVIAIIVWVLRDQLITLVFGKAFLPLASLVPYFAAIIFLRYQGSYYGSILTLRGQQGKRAFAVALTVFAVIAGDLWAIPQYGIQGAAIVLVGAHLLLNFIYMFITHKR